MNKLQLLFFVILTCSAILKAEGQVEYRIITGEKEIYHLQEELKIQLLLHTDQGGCKDGMEKTGIYASGIEIVAKSAWTELSRGSWQILLHCRITGNRKGMAQLTIIRKNDKDNLFRQIKFKINQNG